MQLTAAAQCLAELRNVAGAGHGRTRSAADYQPRPCPDGRGGCARRGAGPPKPRRTRCSGNRSARAHRTPRLLRGSFAAGGVLA
jgi:hypothetical protein